MDCSDIQSNRLGDASSFRLHVERLLKELASTERDEQVLATTVMGLRLLFPDRRFRLTILNPYRGSVSATYAERCLPGEGYPSYSAVLESAGTLYGHLELERLPADTNAGMDLDSIFRLVATQLCVSLRCAALQSEIRRSQLLEQKMIATSESAMLKIDRRGAITEVSRGLELLSGFTRAELLGKPFFAFIDGAEREVIARLTRPGVHDLRLSLVNGRALRGTFYAHFVHGLSGRIDGLLIVMEDKARQQELERRVRHSEKLASLGQLTASIAHEIKNPLSVITMYSAALLERSGARGAPTAEQEKLRRITESSARIDRFVGELMSYCRPSAQARKPYAVSEALARATQFCEHLFRAHGAKFVTALEPELPLIDGDGHDLTQIFVNLLTNACHALPKSGGTITVAARRAEGTIALELSDTGSGIPKAALARIFDPFFSTKPEGVGTGLGLTIVKDLIEKQGGSISVESIEGAGTRFLFSLPMA